MPFVDYVIEFKLLILRSFAEINSIKNKKNFHQILAIKNQILTIWYDSHKWELIIQAKKKFFINSIEFLIITNQTDKYIPNNPNSKKKKSNCYVVVVVIILLLHYGLEERRNSKHSTTKILLLKWVQPFSTPLIYL